MPEQKLAERPKRKSEDVVSDADAQLAKAAEVRSSAEKTLAELDELLDEIDAVLEEESFVAAYVQTGGE